MRISETFQDTIRRSGLFDAAWYVETYRDVAALGLDPFEHFIRFGLPMGRDPGPGFDTRFYRAENPDVAAAGLLPLDHYLRHGRREGRRTHPSQPPGRHCPAAEPVAPAPVPAPAATRLTEEAAAGLTAEAARARIAGLTEARLDGKPQRLFESFDTAAETAFLAAAARIRLDDAARFAAIKVSVIMPTFNRGDRIGAAIRSAQAQTHENFELLIVDDGSTDGTKEVLASFAADPRIRVFENPHLGVSAARNTGLQNARGTYVFYLDSDNTWTPDFLAAMITAFEVSGKGCLYGASCLRNARDELIGYRGEPFDWEQCLSGNFIDMNVFAHHIDLVARYGPFDTVLERMVDWDLILRYTRHEGAGYCPVIGCNYFEDSDDAGRITTSKPYIFRKIVHEKNRRGLATAADTLAVMSLSFALKIPAPYDVRHAWGDFHYAESLKTALEALGHSVRIDFLGDWDRHHPNATDVTLVLRGLSGYIPRPSEFSVLWNISHPDQVPYEEYAAYKIICVASVSYAALLSAVLGRPVQPMLQCTDSRRFACRDHDHIPGRPGVFVGNSRREYRDIVRWAVEAGIGLDIYGQHWEAFLPEGLVKAENLSNHDLAETYAGAQFVLNDHWASMKDFGIVSNRVFDVVGCGGRLVSDEIASINDICDGVVEIVDGPGTLKATLSRPLPPVARAQRRAVADKIHAEHSFDARARELVSHIGDALLGPAHNPLRVVKSTPRKARRKRVGLLLQPGRAWPTSSAFIRLIAPLTTEYAHRELEILQLEGAADPRLDDCDICIVQRIALRDDAGADHLLDRLVRLGVPLYVDTDDAFFFHDQHKADDAVLQRLMAAARESWFSTPALMALYAHVPGPKRVIENTLDPRLWRNYRQPVRTTFDDETVRFVYMGTATHDGDFQEALAGFERLARDRPGKFDLTIVGAVRHPPELPWIKLLGPPADKGGYPDFARWMVANNNFDVGIAPLADSAFNHAKSDIKTLDYAALGLVPLVSECPAYAPAIEAGLAIGCPSGAWYDRAVEIVDAPRSFEPHRARALDHVWRLRNTLTASRTLVDLLMAPYRT